MQAFILSSSSLLISRRYFYRDYSGQDISDWKSLVGLGVDEKSTGLRRVRVRNLLSGVINICFKIV